MQEIKNNADIPKKGSILPLKKYLQMLKRLFIYWIILAIVIGIITVIFNFTKEIFSGRVSTIVNFSFDGIESGVDPNGNKFDENEIKSEEIVAQSIEELGYQDVDKNVIIRNISVDGVIPNNVIERITKFTPVYDSGSFNASENMLDTTYYPTQYKIEIECNGTGLSKKEAADLLNKITEKYNNTFYKKYGYNTSLENAVLSVDYKSYDYVDAVSVFDSSLNCLKDYINELAKKDTIRFRSEKGYTFSDISSSIDTICNEDLDLISSYIMVNNVTKDKENLIASYKYRIEELKRSKDVAEKNISFLEKTIEAYEKDSIIIFGNTTDISSSSITQTSETYNDLISQKIAAQSTFSKCEQRIDLYNKRINSLTSSSQNKSEQAYVEEEFDRISGKINSILDITNETASEYYEKVVLSNAYAVLQYADYSWLIIIKNSVNDSRRTIFNLELILASGYLTLAVVLYVMKKQHILEKISKTNKKVKSKKNKNKNK